jgi:hypothetical protein
MKRTTPITLFFSMLLVLVGNPSHAIDFTDNSQPTFTMKLVNNGANVFNALVFEVKAADDKNGIRLQDWRDGTEFITSGRSAVEFWTVGPNLENLAPACYLRNAILRVWVMDENPPNQDLDFASKSRVFHLITLLDQAKLPEGCLGSEYKLTSEFSTLSVMDEAKNYTLLSYPQKTFVVPVNKSSGFLCFGFGKNPTQYASNYVERYKKLITNSQINIVRYPSFKDEFEKIQKQIVSESSEFLSIIESYSGFGSRPFSLDEFLKLPSCKSSNTLNILEDMFYRFGYQLDELATKAAILAADKAAADKAAAVAKAAADKAAADKAAVVDKAASTKKSTITCIKGKLVKKVTAVKPKCPAGYKVKK